MILRKYPLVTCSTETHSDIIFAEFPGNLKIDLAVAKEIVANRLDFAKNKKHYVVLDASNVREITPEAKEYMQRPDTGQKDILGIAFIATNPVSALFANIFIKTQKDFQAKFFSKKKDAFDWIIEHRQKANSKLSLPIE
jgi:hypothetical protein